MCVPGNAVPSNIANMDAAPTGLDDSVPPVPVEVQAPLQEFVPPGNGPGLLACEVHLPQPHGGLWFHIDTGVNIRVTCLPDKLAHSVHSAGHCGTAGGSSMAVTFVKACGCCMRQPT